MRYKLASYGLQPSDIPKAIVLHELLGVGVLAGCWVACYRLRPTQNLLANLEANLKASPNREIQRAATYLNKIENEARASGFRARTTLEGYARTVQRNTYVRRVPYATQCVDKLKGEWVLGSFVESWVVRKLLAPVLIPLKVWVCYRVVKLFSSQPPPPPLYEGG